MFKFLKSKKMQCSAIELKPFTEADNKCALSLIQYLSVNYQHSWQIIVALEKLEVLLMSTNQMRQIDSRVPKTIDEMITFFNNAQKKISEPEALQSRRISWLLFAALIKRLSLLSMNHTALRDEVAQIWVLLTKAGAYISENIKENVLWDEHEKMYFSQINNPGDGMWYCLNIKMPKHLSSHTRVIEFAGQNNIFLIPESLRK